MMQTASAPASGPPPPSGCSPYDICDFLDANGVEATGELSFELADGVVSGAVFVENGRVCWAAARGMAVRLGDLLASAAGLDGGVMRSLYRTCKEKRVPLGEHLVGSGLVTAEQLRATLLKHTAESLARLCDSAASAHWTPGPAGGYSPRFTFSTAELLVKTLAEAHGAEAVTAGLELAQVMGEGDWGAAFLRRGDRAAPDPVSVFGVRPERIDDLMRLGSWAASSLDLAALLQGQDAFLASALDGASLVAWRSGRMLFAGRTGPLGPARMLNRRAMARRRVSHGLV